MPGSVLHSSGEFCPARARVIKDVKAMKWSKCVAALLLAGLVFTAGFAWGEKTNYKALEKALPPRYREWLNKDVVYLINHQEKQAFLLLASDQDRDNFINQWWELRNPTPGAPSNPYKDEIYERIAYANQYFGGTAGQEGWRTDRGRIYIQLGKPKQRDYKPGYQKIRPIEIWFYDSTVSPALPPYFYVMFYDRDGTRDYRLYSPYQDGPEKLVTSLDAQNGRLAAWKTIDKEAGREIARTTLTLLPDEPVDYNTANSSLASDVLLATIKNLPNHPLTKEVIDRKRELMATVTHRVILPGEYVNVYTVPLRDAGGNINLHYVMRVKKPEDFAVAQGEGDRFYYSVQVSARVHTADGKLIYAQEKELSDYLSRAQIERVKGRLFGYEGWLPLAPGRYKIDFVLTNKLRQTGYREERDVVVPEPPSSGLRMSEVVPFSEVAALEQGSQSVVPFAAGGVKFTPLVGDSLEFATGQDLKIFYQIWAPPTDFRQNMGKKLNVEYAYGRPGASGDTHTVQDTVPKEQFDAAGSEITGKKITLSDAVGGNYRLTVTVSDPDSRQKTFSSLSFRVSGSTMPPRVWDIYDEKNNDVISGLADYERGLVLLANGNKSQAEAWFRNAVSRSPSNQRFVSKLVDMLFARQAYGDIAKLYAGGAMTDTTDELTILRMAEALDKAGTTSKAIELLESALQTRKSSGSLYLTLASYYQRVGDLQKASDLQKKGKSLMPGGSPTT